MKKMTALLLCLVMLTGCSQTGTNVSAQDQTPAESAASVSAEPETESTAEPETQSEPEADSSAPAEEPQAAEMPEIDTTGAYLVLDASDAYDGAYSFVVEEAGTYSFGALSASGFEELSWEIYLLDEEFEDGLRYLPQVFDPVLTVGNGEDGDVVATADQFVYCVCSLNSFTDDRTEGAGKLVVRFAPAVMEVTEEQEVLGDTMEMDASDAYQDAVQSFQADRDGVVTARCETTEGQEPVEWTFYVLDEPFEEAYRYLGQAYEPVLTGDGSFAVKAGQYVYCWSSVNAFTADEAPERGTSVLHLEIS